MSKKDRAAGKSDKGPARGARLDAQKREEYVADVSEKEKWDTSSWSAWMVTGRVLPERCNVRIADESQGKLTKDRVLSMMAVGTTLTAKEALESGLVHEIAEPAVPRDAIWWQV